MGVVTGVQPDMDGEHLWIVERCGGNQCADSSLNPIHKLDSEGRTVKSIGAGIFAWPHGFDMDADGNFWITEGAPAGDARGEPGMEKGMGHQVIKMNQEGEVLMRLGEAAVAGEDELHFNGPAAVLVAPNGDIWIADGHRGGNNRIVRLRSDGTFVRAVGGGVQTVWKGSRLASVNASSSSSSPAPFLSCGPPAWTSSATPAGGAAACPPCFAARLRRADTITVMIPD